MARELLVGVTLKFNDTDPDNFAVIDRNVPERLRNEGDQCATTIVLPRALCARIAAHFNWVKAKENDEEFRNWLESEAGVMLESEASDGANADLHVLVSAVGPEGGDEIPDKNCYTLGNGDCVSTEPCMHTEHDHDVTRMADEGCPH